MRYFLMALGLLFTATVIAQGGGQMPGGSIYGKVVDSATGKGLEAASIQIYQTQLPGRAGTDGGGDSASKTSKDILVTGMLTAANGDFRLENIPAMGRYKLVISGVGHKTHTRPFSFIDPKMMSGGKPDMQAIMGALDKDLGNIKLATDVEVLSGVTVTASKPAVQLGIDRKIYNVENNLTSAGGTATDVLKNVPSVNVDIDGNISVRNASPQIFVDGRPTTLTLDQIPADQIASVEVITNPSAKYDASGGTAGILNIVLKKTRTVGYNGSLRAGIDERGRYNFGGNLNVRQGKFNVFANVGYNQRKTISDGTTERNTFLNDTTVNLYQTDRAIGDGRFLFARAGFDYFLDNRNTLTLSGMTVDGKFDNVNTSDILTTNRYPAGSDQSRIARTSDANFGFNMKGGAVGFVHNFPKNGHQLTADGQYNKSNNNSKNLLNNNIFAVNGGPQTGTFRQLQEGAGNNERINAQIDYTNPLTDKTKLEAGVRYNQTKTFSENVLSRYENGGFVRSNDASAKFNFTDQVYAAYANFSSKIGEKFGYQLGLRLESSEYNGQFFSGAGYSKTDQFKIAYPASLFPSVFLSYQLSQSQQLQLNYSRRINRPGFFQLFPFITDYSDTLNLSLGNANLRPEFTNSFELSYSKTFDKSNNLIVSTYYKHTDDLITRYQTRGVHPLTSDSVILNTFLNANSSFVGGLEIVSKNAPAKWWDLTTNVNVYTSKINVNDPLVPTADQIYSWFAKINNSFKLPKNFTLQVSGDYNSKTVLAPGGSGNSGGGGGRGGFGGTVSGNAQGYSMPTYGVDVAVKFEFLKGKTASVTLSGSDIFKTRVSDIYTNAGFFNQHQYRVRDQQFFSINFAYRFGKFDASLLKRKNLKAEQEGMQGGMQGMPQ
ncbi:TonB-dependent receptor family protein [Niabella yanshanensis]|uniref:TonB-dependent receptor family protein n=1 Tax=Niabella yanshanensis TaxID=577386 RepID=A0ABZ0WBU7_9BACT|nr:TonB-dependent receptor family protein [Niabella yanshanensis]WQD39107.1 TonB-dependent receptor family protein [Niabella yanshanensis]